MPLQIVVEHLWEEASVFLYAYGYKMFMYLWATSQISRISFELCIIDWHETSRSFVDFWCVQLVLGHLDTFYFHNCTLDLLKVKEAEDI